MIENHRAPVVTHMVWYRVGAADEVPGKTGIAHFIEHLMFKGTKTVPPGAFSEMVARLGGSENAFTSEDYTAYFQSVAVEHLETMMKLEADRMLNLVLTDDVVMPERDVILEERRQRVDNDPGSQLHGDGARRALPQPSLSHADDRLGDRDARPDHGRRHRLAHEMVPARQRHRRHLRRRDHGPGAAAGGEILRRPAGDGRCRCGRGPKSPRSSRRGG